ncbi:hypothetical protein QR721_12075 [Aciduricibacillus chroicocephali]|uniref:Uncharacterized protein n=1 Tax=Aciduricibacillus chroicocephali TaxID=3054939 RepID=A0ABY9KXN1_9BACI|nr:hypothetical protein QR721_12075 [Bacillaceae bacterium 44XB]
MRRILYYLLIVFLIATMLYNVVFDLDLFALIINLGALAGVLILPKLNK